MHHAGKNMGSAARGLPAEVSGASVPLFWTNGLTLDLLDDESGKPRKNRIHVPGFALGYRAGAVHKDFMVTLWSLVGSVVLAGVLKNGQTIRIVRRGRPRHRRSEHD